jgi:CMP-N-acetylneuraminic acid synthetase
MTKHRQSVAVIPARGGSKRLANKMLRPLGGKTLVQRAVEVVLASACFDRVIVSSDSDAVLESLASYRIDARQRRAELATDTATTMDVLMDLLNDVAVLDETVVALCQPTTPFRTADDLRATVALLAEGVDSSIAIMAAPIPPQRSFPLGASGECLIPEASPLLRGVTRHQQYEDMFTPNGAAYVSTAGHIRRSRSFFAGRVRGHVMPRERSLDIDDEIDWQLAELLLSTSKHS